MNSTSTSIPQIGKEQIVADLKRIGARAPKAFFAVGFLALDLFNQGLYDKPSNYLLT